MRSFTHTKLTMRASDSSGWSESGLVMHYMLYLRSLFLHKRICPDNLVNFTLEYTGGLQPTDGEVFSANMNTCRGSWKLQKCLGRVPGAITWGSAAEIHRIHASYYEDIPYCTQNRK